LLRKKENIRVAEEWSGSSADPGDGHEGEKKRVDGVSEGEKRIKREVKSAERYTRERKERLAREALRRM